MNREVILRDKPFEALILRIHITFNQDDFSFRVGIDEVFGKADTGGIGHSAVIARQSIPVLSSKNFTVIVVFGLESGRPRREVVEFVECCVAMVGGFAAEKFERGLHGDCARTRHAQG